MAELAAEGLVDLDPHPGLIVHEPTESELLEVYELRSLLDPVCIAKTVANITEAEIERAAVLCHRMESVTEPGAWVALNSKFHAHMDNAARSPLLAATIRDLRNRSSIYVAASLPEAPERMGSAMRSTPRWSRRVAAGTQTLPWSPPTVTSRRPLILSASTSDVWILELLDTTRGKSCTTLRGQRCHAAKSGPSPLHTFPIQDGGRGTTSAWIENNAAVGPDRTRRSGMELVDSPADYCVPIPDFDRVEAPRVVHGARSTVVLGVGVSGVVVRVGLDPTRSPVRCVGDDAVEKSGGDTVTAIGRGDDVAGDPDHLLRIDTISRLVTLRILGDLGGVQPACNPPVDVCEIAKGVTFGEPPHHRLPAHTPMRWIFYRIPSRVRRQAVTARPLRHSHEGIVVEEGNPVIDPLLGDRVDDRFADCVQPLRWSGEPLGGLCVVADALLGIRPVMVSSRVGQEGVSQLRQAGCSYRLSALEQ